MFTCPDRKSLEEVLDKVYAAGYPDTMIIQDFIPGDDSYMRVLTNYSDRNGKVKLMCMGHVLLEEHTGHAIGNHAVILTEPCGEIAEKIRAFLEDIGYVGFSNFDIKYDQRDGKFKAFEINCRQGRSNYYVTGAGYNIAKLLVEDRVEGKDLPFVLADNPSLWRVVPRKGGLPLHCLRLPPGDEGPDAAGERGPALFYRTGRCCGRCGWRRTCWGIFRSLSGIISARAEESGMPGRGVLGFFPRRWNGREPWLAQPGPHFLRRNGGKNPRGKRFFLWTPFSGEKWSDAVLLP